MSTMVANRIGLIGLVAIILTATAALAQNTGASMQAGILSIQS